VPSQPSEGASKPAPAADGRPVIVALGDSLTAGLGVAPEEGYPARLQRLADRRGYRYRVVNAGVSGDTTAGGLNRLEAVRAEHPAFVILALGANDGLRGLPVGTTRKNLEAMILRLEADGTKVVLAGMQMPPNYGPEYTEAFFRMFREVGGSYNLPFIPFLLAGVAGRADLNQADGVHPTGAGYEIVAENVWRVLEPLLAKNR
jgi:acyl-CoA thioesterase-1